MQIAFYASHEDHEPVSLALTWERLAALLGEHTRTPCAPCDGKTCSHKFGRAWSPVEYAPCPPKCRNHGKKKAHDCGGGRFHRLNANVHAIHAIAFDVDTLDFDGLRELLGRLDASGLACIVHSSHSYAPPEAAKVRLVFRPSRTITPEEWHKVRRVLQRRLGIPGDEATKDEARLFFLPTAPEGAPTIAGSTAGADVDVDDLLAEEEQTQALAVTMLAEVVDVPEVEEAADPNELRRTLRSLRTRYRSSGRQGDNERADILDCILAPRALAQEGERDSRLNRACSILTAALPRGTPIEAMLDLLTPSISRMPGDEGLDHWLDEAEDMLERAKERREERDAEQRAFNAEVRARLMAESLIEGEEEPEASPVGQASLSYTDEQLEAWATEQGTTAEGMQRRWIIQKGKAFWVFVGGKYLAPISRDDLAVSLPRDLARAPVQIVAEDKDGNERPRSVDSILRDYASNARHVQASLALQRSFYDPRTQTFYEAVTPLRNIRAKEHPEIDRWLRLLGGPQADKLLDWVATCARLDRQSCAIYIDGVKGSGKNLLATGLARLWTVGGPSELSRVLEGFNDSLINCPLVFADEALPQRKGITADLRRLIGSTTRTLRRLYTPSAPLDGAIRVIIAGNNDRLLDTGEDLSANDLEAVAERFLYLPPGPTEAAAEYLREIGGPPVINAWIRKDKIAEHALWLQATRKVNETGRFLVQGEAQEFHSALATSSGLTGLVCEWVTRYLADPATASPTAPRANLLLAGHGEVWISADALTGQNEWEKRVPSAKVPSAARIGRALRNLSKGTERLRVDGRQIRYHALDVRLLRTWAARSTVIDVEAFDARVHGEHEKLKTALDARLTVKVEAAS